MNTQSTLPQHVKLVEVGPRDGLQNEKQFVGAAVKVELVERLARAGFANIEAASFVSPKWVPQMATSAEVMARIERLPHTLYSALTPNMQGFEAALAAKAGEVVIFGSASEALSQKNINCSIAESIARFEPVAKAAKHQGWGRPARVAWAFAAPYRAKCPCPPWPTWWAACATWAATKSTSPTPSASPPPATPRPSCKPPPTRLSSTASPDIFTIPTGRRWRTSTPAWN